MEVASYYRRHNELKPKSVYLFFRPKEIGRHNHIKKNSDKALFIMFRIVRIILNLSTMKYPVRCDILNHVFPLEMNQLLSPAGATP